MTILTSSAALQHDFDVAMGMAAGDDSDAEDFEPTSSSREASKGTLERPCDSGGGNPKPGKRIQTPSGKGGGAQSDRVHEGGKFKRPIKKRKKGRGGVNVFR